MAKFCDRSKLREEAQERISRQLGRPVELVVLRGFSEAALEDITRLDNVKFREELRYSREEAASRMQRPGFLCLLVYSEGGLVAFEYGYDMGEGVFFSDSQASLVEGRGIGSTLFALEIILQYLDGYRKVMLFTEEVDGQGRRLREFWERLGFKKTSEEEEGGTSPWKLSWGRIWLENYTIVS